MNKLLFCCGWLLIARSCYCEHGWMQRRTHVRVYIEVSLRRRLPIYTAILNALLKSRFKYLNHSCFLKKEKKLNLNILVHEEVVNLHVPRWNAWNNDFLTGSYQLSLMKPVFEISLWVRQTTQFLYDRINCGDLLCYGHVTNVTRRQ